MPGVPAPLAANLGHSFVNNDISKNICSFVQKYLFRVFKIICSVSKAKNICCHLETGLAGEVQGEGQQPGRVLAGAGRGVVVEVQLVPLLAPSLAIGRTWHPHPHLLRTVPVI